MNEEFKFRQLRRITSMWKCALEQISDVKAEHDAMVERLHNSLSDMEEFLREKGVEVELCHLVNYADFLDDKRVSHYRKKILDWGNSLKREVESE